MKRKLTLILVLALVVTMFMSIPAMAADDTLILDPTDFTTGDRFSALKSAIENPDGPSTIIITRFTTSAIWGSQPITVDREVTIIGYRSNPNNINTGTNFYTRSTGTPSPADLRLFVVTENGNLTLENVQLRGTRGSTIYNGGVEINGGKLYLNGVHLLENVHGAAPGGGAIAMNGGYLEINNCKFENNGISSSSASPGASIYAYGGAEAIIKNTEFVISDAYGPVPYVVGQNSSDTPAIVVDDPAVTKVWFQDVTIASGLNGDGVSSWSATDQIGPENDYANYGPGEPDPVNTLGVSGAQGTDLGSADFSFDALLQLNNVNLIKAEFSYDASKFSIEAVAVPEGLTVNKIDVLSADGKVEVLLGVAGLNGAFAHETLSSLVSFKVRAIDGTPETATLTLVSATLYAKGVIVDYDVVNQSATVTLDYRVPYDINGDGVVDHADLSIALYYFGITQTDDLWVEAASSDLNGDGIVDMLDITILIEAIYG